MPASGSRPKRASRLAHDHVIPIYDLGEEQGYPYLVVEYLPGESLAEYIERAAPLPLDEALTLAHGIATGVGYANSRGLIHGDLRPSDVLFTTDHRPKVGDFGLVTTAAGERGRSDEAAARPSAYVAPEQLAGEPATAESDVYALGAILYELLTGRSSPRRAASDAPDADEAAQSRTDPAWELPAEIPPDIRHLVLGAVAADPHTRYVDGIEMAAAIAEEHERQRFGSQYDSGVQRPEPDDDYEPRARQPAAQARQPAALPNRGSAGGSGALGIVFLAVVFIAFIVVLAGAGLSFPPLAQPHSHHLDPLRAAHARRADGRGADGHTSGPALTGSLANAAPHRQRSARAAAGRGESEAGRAVAERA